MNSSIYDQLTGKQPDGPYLPPGYERPSESQTLVDSIVRKHQENVAANKKTAFKQSKELKRQREIVSRQRLSPEDQSLAESYVFMSMKDAKGNELQPDTGETEIGSFKPSPTAHKEALALLKTPEGRARIIEQKDAWRRARIKATVLKGGGSQVDAELAVVGRPDMPDPVQAGPTIGATGATYSPSPVTHAPDVLGNFGGALGKAAGAVVDAPYQAARNLAIGATHALSMPDVPGDQQRIDEGPQAKALQTSTHLGMYLLPGIGQWLFRAEMAGGAIKGASEGGPVGAVKGIDEQLGVSHSVGTLLDSRSSPADKMGAIVNLGMLGWMAYGEAKGFMKPKTPAESAKAARAVATPAMQAKIDDALKSATPEELKTAFEAKPNEKITTKETQVNANEADANVRPQDDAQGQAQEAVPTVEPPVAPSGVKEPGAYLPPNDGYDPKFALTNPKVKGDGYGRGTKFEVPEPEGDMVTVYRAVPLSETEIKPGQYVTASRAYAEDHLANHTSGRLVENPELVNGGHIIEAQVPKADLQVYASNELSWEPAPPVAPSGVKEPWQMTRAEITNEGLSPVNGRPLDEVHRRSVVNAIAEGKPVPPSVVAEYPGVADEAKAIIADQERIRVQKQRIDEQNAEIAFKSEQKPRNPLEPWQQIREDYVGSGTPGAAMRRAEHNNSVVTALKEGKPVPPEVLADYPDLAPPVAPEAPQGAVQGPESANLVKDPEFDTVMYAHSGMNPAELLKPTNYDLPPNSEGGYFKAPERTPSDWKLTDDLKSPLSVLDEVTGKTVRAGTYEHRAGEAGKSVSKAMSAAERELSTKTSLYQARMDRIGENLDQAMNDEGLHRMKRTKAKVKDFYEKWIGLIEGDRSDPAREAVKNSDTAIGKALKEHDALTDEVRQYIVDSRRSMGIETPDDWGITEKGYYRHLFLGDIEMRVMQPDGSYKLVGTARTYPEAQKMAFDILDADPKAKIQGVPRRLAFADPSLRVSTKKYWRLVNDLVGKTGLDQADILEDLRGTVGRNAAKNKFFGALLQRKGAEGFSKDYMDVMRVHVAQAARSQELSKLNHAVMPLIEKVRSAGQPGVADAMTAHMSALWGTPTKAEAAFGQMVKGLPVIGDHVPVPSFAMRSLAQKLTSVQYLLKLKYNLKSSAVNFVQPLQTLWPYVSTKDFASIYAEALKPSVRAELAAKGALDIGGKVEHGLTGGKAARIAKADPFQAGSHLNRAVGYIYGHRDAVRRGADEATAHAAGMEWAKRVEFDSSVWGVQPALRSSGGRILGQFKGFTGKSLENMAQVWKRGDSNGLERIARIAKYHGGLAVSGGAKAAFSPFKMAGVLMAAKLYDEMKQRGASEEEATSAANAVAGGAPGLMGSDISSSLTLFDLYGKDAKERVSNFVLGPTVSTGAALFDAAQKYAASEDNPRGKTAEEKRKTILGAAGRALTPYARTGHAWSQALTGQPVTVTLGSKEVELPMNEAVMMMLGFSPNTQTKFYDDQELKGFLKMLGIEQD